MAGLFDDAPPQKGLFDDAPPASLQTADSVPTPSFSISKTIKNIPSSAYSFGEGIVNAVKSPIQTAKGLTSIVKGGIESGTEADVIPKMMETNPQDIQAFENFKDNLKNRYGSFDNLKETIQNDPVGFLADASTVLSGGGSLAKASGLARTGQVLSKAGEFTEPLGMAAKIAKPIIRGVGEGVSGVLGTTTGAQYGNVREALFNPNKDLTDQMRGNTGQQDIVSVAKDGLQSIKDQRSQEYLDQLKKVQGSTKQIDLVPIKQKMNDLLSQFKVKQISNPNGGIGLDFSRSPINKSAANDIQEMVDTVNDWGKQPGDDTAIGLDTLKRKLDDYYTDSSQARAFTTNLKNTVKDQIVKNVPEYEKLTSDYQSASSHLADIQKAFSLGGTSGTDTVIRKLTQTLRQNFEFRNKLAQDLSDASGKNIQSMVAGNQLSTVEPRGLARLGATAVGGGMGTAVMMHALNPAFLGTLAFSSPRLVGELLSAIGYSSQAINDTLSKIYTPQRAQAIYQASKGNQ